MREVFASHFKQTCALVGLALALRLFLATAAPHAGGDSPVYEAFARNLLRSGTYSHLEPHAGANPRPTAIRVPGYPLMLAAIFAVAGENNETSVRVVQAFLDTLTCLLVALLVLEMAEDREADRQRLAQWALFLAAVCPFVANYAASVLTEVPTTLLWTAATLCGLRALKGRAPRRNWLWCGLLTGGATLFRPESGILLGILGMVLVLREGLRRAWKSVLWGVGCMGAGLVLALLPWTIRNAVTLHTFQPLAPKFAEDQDEVAPIGYFEWCLSWMWKYRDMDPFWWSIGEDNVPLDSLPAADSASQGQEVHGLIKLYNDRQNSLDKKSDDRFGEIARERRRSHPLRHYLAIPFLRGLSIWFTPRVEIVGLDGNLWPLREAWEDGHSDFTVSLLLFLLNCAYVTMAIWGAGKVVRRRRSFADVAFLGCFTLGAVIIIRTAFFGYYMLPEPRYILEAYPELIALAAVGSWRRW